MKKTFLLFLFTASLLMGQGLTWQWLNPKPTGSDFNDVVALGNFTVLGFGSGGFVVRTTDAGLTWNIIVADTLGRDIYEADFVDNLNGYLCGLDGLLMKTTDGGITWNYLNLNGSVADFWYLDFYNINKGIIAGASGKVFRTNDGGATFDSTTAGTATIYNVHYADSATIYLGTSSTTTRLFRSTNGGDVWDNIHASLPITGTYTIRGISFRGLNSGILSTSNGKIMRTTDGGTTFDSLTIGGTSEALYDVKYDGPTIGYMPSTNGNIFKTTDGGVSWNRIATGTTENLYSFAIINTLSDGNSTVYAAGRYGTITKSTDMGTTWSPLFSALTQETNRSVFFINQTTGFVVGGFAVDGATSGEILKTTDAGETWSKITTPNYRNYSTFWLNDQVGFIGQRGTAGIYKTTDGGTTWNALTLPLGGTSGIWYDIYFQDANTGYACGSSNALIKTTDGGATWTALTTPFASTNVLYDMHAFGPNTFMIVGSASRWAYTTDGGTTFSTGLVPGTSTTLYGVHFSGNTGLIVGSSGRAWMSTDGGVNWTQQTTNSLSTLYAAYMATPLIGWIGGSGGSILYTTDGGTNWVTPFSPLSSIHTTYGITGAGGYLYLVGGAGGHVVRTYSDPNIPVELTSFSASVSGNDVILSWATATETNNSGFEIERKTGSDWVNIGFVAGSGTSTLPKSYSFTDAAPGVSEASYRLKQIDLDGSFSYSNAIEVSFNPVTFSLEQNYPNPFNPSTTIRFSLPDDANVKLDIYNSNGELVKTLINSGMKKGFHSVNFDASGFASGVYLYRIDAGSFSSVRKMLLMK
ncbi:MAG: T9SS type A sorting domain-containing protein [Ignavibacteriaceae bacterium]|nr:T9SS type A sorting domain-containing protein [Ignavibacteriaceae bacterium]